MKKTKIIFFSLLLMIGLVACGPENPVPEENPVFEVVNLQITPAVAHWLPLVAACAEDIPNFGIFTEVLPRSDLSVEESDLILRLGERLETDPFVATMGMEDIVIIAGEGVPVSSLSLESLQKIFTGETTRWDEISDNLENESVVNEPITPLSYPEGHEIEILFRRTYLDDNPINIDLQVYSTIEFLQDLLIEYPFAITYVLESQVPEGVRVLSITHSEPIPTGQYVLAITKGAPDGGLKQLLLCLQNAQ
jgi:hypothetical protein